MISSTSALQYTFHELYRNKGKGVGLNKVQNIDTQDAAWDSNR